MAPNGTNRTPEQSKALREAFAEIAPVLEVFAAKHRLVIDRYYHDFPSWELRFTRKIGGNARISVVFNEKTRKHFEVIAAWYVDNFKTKKRYSRGMKPSLIFSKSGDIKQLEQMLETALQTIDSWEPDNWDDIVGPFRVWREKTKEEFENRPPKYPVR